MDFGVFIPILAIATGLVAVFGRTIWQPMLQLKHRELQSASVERLEQRIAELESRLASTEGTVDTLLEERDFMRKLTSARSPADPAATAFPTPSAPPPKQP